MAKVAAVVLALVIAGDASRSKVHDVTANASDDTDPGMQIVNGRKASRCELPYQIALTNSLGQLFCGGTLLNEKWVLTAAHCLGSFMNAVAGEHRLGEWNNNRQIKGVRRQIAHPNYNRRSQDSDIALLELESPFTLNDCVEPLRLPSTEVWLGTTCKVSGWGSTEQRDGESRSGGQEFPSTLKVAQVKVMSNRDCHRNFDYYDSEITSNMICANERNSKGHIDACQGDSGGPLACNGKIVGVVSWGFGCADKDYPGVYARTHKFLNWIQSHIG